MKQLVITILAAMLYGCDEPECYLHEKYDDLKVCYVSSELLQELSQHTDDFDALTLGSYVHSHKAIYLRYDIDIDRPRGRGVLLHEEVHYLQWKHGEHYYKCIEELEHQAYTVENNYLANFGLSVSLPDPTCADQQ